MPERCALPLKDAIVDRPKDRELEDRAEHSFGRLEAKLIGEIDSHFRQADAIERSRPTLTSSSSTLANPIITVNALGATMC
jgi:hypothetical protein